MKLSINENWDFADMSQREEEGDGVGEHEGHGTGGVSKSDILCNESPHISNVKKKHILYNEDFNVDLLRSLLNKNSVMLRVPLYICYTVTHVEDDRIDSSSLQQLRVCNSEDDLLRGWRQPWTSCYQSPLISPEVFLDSPPLRRLCNPQFTIWFVFQIYISYFEGHKKRHLHMKIFRASETFILSNLKLQTISESGQSWEVWSY